MFPSLKGFDLCLDPNFRSSNIWPSFLFPSLKGFDLCLDRVVRVLPGPAPTRVSIPQRVRPLPRPFCSLDATIRGRKVSIPQRVRPLPRQGAVSVQLQHPVQVSIPQRVRPLPRLPTPAPQPPRRQRGFPSLKGFDLCLDGSYDIVDPQMGLVSIPQRVRPLPRRAMFSRSLKPLMSFHPSKGSTSA